MGSTAVWEYDWKVLLSMRALVTTGIATWAIGAGWREGTARKLYRAQAQAYQLTSPVNKEDTRI
jgi:hypothetical protein